MLAVVVPPPPVVVVLFVQENMTGTISIVIIVLSFEKFIIVVFVLTSVL